MPGEIDLRRILDRQNMASARRHRRMIRDAREHDLAGYRCVVQKAPIPFRCRSIAAEIT
jgi:hypothetical protein